MSLTKTRIDIRTLSNSTTDPKRAGEKMLVAAKANTKLARKTQSVNLMEGLLVRRVGTNLVEKIAKMMADDDERDERLVVKLMSIMVWLTRRKQLSAKKSFQKAKREADKVLPAGWRRKRFQDT